MRRFWLVLVALFVVGCAQGKGQKESAVKPVQVVVMTYNIHAGKGMDGKIDLPRLAEVIRGSGADFVALQEVDKGTKRSGGVDQASELGRLLGMHVVFGKAMDFGGGEFGNAVLLRGGWKVEESTVVALPWREGGKREARAAVGVKVRVPGAGEPVEFVSTHLDHTGERVGDPSDRVAQVGAINAAWGGARGPVILGGDFNCELSSEAMGVLLKEWKLVSGREDGVTCCGKAEAQTVKIDHVVVKGGWKAVEARVVDDTMASDHRPVVVKLEWGGK